MLIMPVFTKRRRATSSLLWVLLSLSIVILSANAQATDYYVATTGSNATGDGSSGNPWKTITYALTQASGPNDTINVAAGTYNPALGESFPINMKDGVSLEGDGAATTILNAAGQGGDYGGVIYCYGIGEGETIDGFTITGGYANYYGGGICIYGDAPYTDFSSPTIKNCLIKNNSSGYYGGGVAVTYSEKAGTPALPQPHAQFVNCTIADNQSSDGGGGFFITFAYPRITNCTITANTAQYGYGGGMYIDYGNAFMVNTIIKGNTAGYGPPNDLDRADNGEAVQFNYCNYDPTHNGIPVLSPSLFNINVAPGFVGGGDYHLASSSLCKDAGTADQITSYGFTQTIPCVDIDADTRPDGSTGTCKVAMGSDEIVEAGCNPLCGIACTDADEDNFFVEGGDCGPVDCNDADNTIYPGAPEVPCDLIDQDCSGEDLCDTGHNTHTGGTAKGPDPLTCQACHVFGGGENMAQMVGAGVCDTCHSPDGAFDGVNDSIIGAAANWTDGVYEDNQATLQPGKEQWCAGCHDDIPAYSRQPSGVAPVIVDNTDAGASWTGSWPTSGSVSGYYGTNYANHVPGAGTDAFRWTPTIVTAGEYSVYARWTAYSNRAPAATFTIYHDSGSTAVAVNQRINGGVWVFLGTFNFDGTNDYVQLVQNAGGYVIADAVKWESGGSGAYASNVTGDNTTYGHYVTGHKLNCLSCHDATKEHIDNLHRTYKAGVTLYNDSYRLRTVNGQPAMNIPRPLYSPGSNPLNYADDFALCFACHNKNEVFSATGVPGKTNFWNNDSSPQNSHNIHLGIYTNHFDSDWNGTADSSESCIACHNVHGAPNQAMVRHGELISSPGTTDKVPALNFAYLLPPTPGTRNTGASLQASIGGSMAYAGPSIAQNKVCTACHWGINYLRTPYLGPRVIAPAADPETVDIGGGPTSALFTATIVDPDNNVTAVTINLASIGGSSSQAMYDNGTNGDATSGDGVYSYLATVSDTIDPGEKSLVITATDPGTSGTNTVVLNVTAPGILIVDNTDAGATFVGAWSTSTYSPGYYGTNYHNHGAGAGTDTFTWTPTVTTSGTYEVFARWTQNPNRAPDAIYTVYHDAGSTPVQKDQRTQGGTWIPLGTFAFDGANNDRIVLGQNPNGYVIADAIKCVLQP